MFILHLENYNEQAFLLVLFPLYFYFFLNQSDVYVF